MADSVVRISDVWSWAESSRSFSTRTLLLEWWHVQRQRGFLSLFRGSWSCKGKKSHSFCIIGKCVPHALRWTSHTWSLPTFSGMSFNSKKNNGDSYIIERHNSSLCILSTMLSRKLWLHNEHHFLILKNRMSHTEGGRMNKYWPYKWAMSPFGAVTA